VEDIRAQLLAAFEVEHRDHLEAIRRSLAAPAKADLREIFRRAHSLKGAARAVDMPEVETLAHELESLFANAMEGKARLAGATLNQIRRLLDAIEVTAAGPGATTAGKDAAEPAAKPGDLIRIDAEAVDRLMLATRELSGAVQGQMAAPDQLIRLADDLRKLEGQWLGLHAGEGVRERDFGYGLKTLSQAVGALVRQQTRAGWALDQATARLRGEVETISLTPAETVLGDLGRMVRGLANEAGVEVNVRIDGLETGAERRIIQALRDPLIHLLRNALSHGAETPAQRKAAGKPQALLVGLGLASRGGRLQIRVYDDGRGPDIARITAAARARGALTDDQQEGPISSEEILALAFEPGVSAAKTVDHLSGRGMGLSVVAETVRALGGSVTLAARRPTGAEVQLSVPISTARQPLVLVEASGDVLAIPAYAVRRTLRIAAASIESVEDTPTIRIQVDGLDVVAPMTTLDSLLGRPVPAVPTDFVHVLLLSRGDRHLGVTVDAVHDVRELILEAVDLAGVDASLVVGAVRLEDETPAAVLNPDALFDYWLRNSRRLVATGIGLGVSPGSPDVRSKTVLVVDDSITTRTLEKSILEAQGYRVLLAVDGVDALQTLRSGDALADLVVADIEMPRMDGFSLLQAIKADAGLAHLPVILMTSRDDPQDIRRGMDLGAEAYITKQKFDQRELLGVIGRLL